MSMLIVLRVFRILSNESISMAQEDNRNHGREEGMLVMRKMDGNYLVTLLVEMLVDRDVWYILMVKNMKAILRTIKGMDLVS